MNKFILILLAFTFTFISCAKDDLEKLEESTWVIITVAITNCEDTEYNELILAGATEPCEASQLNCEYQEFTFSDGTYTVIESSTSFNGSLSTNMDEGTYTKTDDLFTICSDGDCETFTVSVNGESMIWKGESDDGEGCELEAIFKKK